MADTDSCDIDVETVFDHPYHIGPWTRGKCKYADRTENSVECSDSGAQEEETDRTLEGILNQDEEGENTEMTQQVEVDGFIEMIINECNDVENTVLTEDEVEDGLIEALEDEDDDVEQDSMVRTLDDLVEVMSDQDEENGNKEEDGLIEMLGYQSEKVEKTSQTQVHVKVKSAQMSRLSVAVPQTKQFPSRQATVCSICWEVFSSAYSLKRHINRRHPEKYLKLYGPMSNKQWPEKAFERPYKLIRLSEREEDGPIEVIYNRKEKVENASQMHDKSSQINRFSVAVSQTKQKLPYKQEIKKIIQLPVQIRTSAVADPQTKQKPPSKQPTKCGICCEVVSSAFSLKRHITRKHPESLGLVPENQLPEIKFKRYYKELIRPPEKEEKCHIEIIHNQSGKAMNTELAEEDDEDEESMKIDRTYEEEDDGAIDVNQNQSEKVEKTPQSLIDLLQKSSLSIAIPQTRKMPPSKQAVKCGICYEVNSSSFCLKRHISRKHPEIYRKFFGSMHVKQLPEIKLKRHIKLIHNQSGKATNTELPEEDDEEMISNKDEESENTVLMDEIEDDSVIEVIKNQSEKVGNTPQVLIKLQTNSLSIPIPQTRERPPSKQAIKCGICYEVNATSFSLKRHISRKHPEIYEKFFGQQLPEITIKRSFKYKKLIRSPEKEEEFPIEVIYNQNVKDTSTVLSKEGDEEMISDQDEESENIVQTDEVEDDSVIEVVKNQSEKVQNTSQVQVKSSHIRPLSITIPQMREKPQFRQATKCLNNKTIQLPVKINATAVAISQAKQKPPSKQATECGICSEVVSSAFCLKRHIIRRHPEMIHNQSGKVQNISYVKVKPVQINSSKIVVSQTKKNLPTAKGTKCGICSKLLWSASMLKSHIMTKHPETYRKLFGQVLEKPLQETTFAHSGKYRKIKLVQISPLVIDVPQTKNKPPSKQPKSCQICSEVLSSSFTLMRHMGRKHPE